MWEYEPYLKKLIFEVKMYMLEIIYESEDEQQVIVEFYRSLRQAKDSYKLHHYNYCKATGEDLKYKEIEIIEGYEYKTTFSYTQDSFVGIIMSIKF